MKDRAGVAAARALPAAPRRAAAAIQVELEWEDLRPRRELTFPEWLAEGYRRYKALESAIDRMRSNPTAAARSELSRCRHLWAEHTEGRLELMDSLNRQDAS